MNRKKEKIPDFTNKWDITTFYAILHTGMVCTSELALVLMLVYLLQNWRMESWLLL